MYLLSEEIQFSNLGLDELQSVCQAAEMSVRLSIFSKIQKRLVDDLNVTVSVEGDSSSFLDIEVDLSLSPLLKETNVTKLVNAAIDQGFLSAEQRAREILACKSRR